MYEEERQALKVIQRQLAEVDVDQLTNSELMEIARLIDYKMNGYCQQLVHDANIAHADYENFDPNDNQAIDNYNYF